ncbi:dynactin subunit 3-like [Tropilaelaps mercedesae]|uniref:Dynactin subunit 3-like n=1 Tax=Tropilaelaps mercedesae TaxID=418985 RepID=A0A1V9X825_9ACAR|nr:dynactin subunit 3-like [Tropilaelaps mercedesae]
MDAGALKRLEARVFALERQVKGDLPDHDQSIAQRLIIIDKKLTTTIQDKNTLGILKRTDALDALLDPGLERSVGLDSSTKFALLEANADRLQEAAQIIEKVDSLKSVLESAHIKSVPMHSARLSTLRETQTEELERVQGLTRQVMAIFETYNRIMANINRKFALWDQRLGAAEERIQARK